jgi:lysophosphatidylcholine acyltransferase/lyso-PAF acetyltransferase
MRTVWFIAGFHWVRTIGKRATSREAQVLIAAPHSSYFDSFVVTYLGGPSVVAKEDAKKLPFFGSKLRFYNKKTF